MSVQDPSPSSGPTSPWPLTDWSGLHYAAESVGKDSDALNRLLLKYQLPLKVYLLCSFPNLKHQADDLLQEFITDRILREGWLRIANPKRGRLRDFLKTSLRNFVKDRLRASPETPASLEELELDPPAEESRLEPFDVHWAGVVVTETLKRMEQDCCGPGKEQPRRATIWEVFRRRILLPNLEDVEPVSYDRLISDLKIVSSVDAQNMLATAKRIFIRHLNSVVGEYENAGEAVRLEIEELKSAVRGLSGEKMER